MKTGVPYFDIQRIFQKLRLKIYLGWIFLETRLQWDIAFNKASQSVKCCPSLLHSPGDLTSLIVSRYSYFAFIISFMLHVRVIDALSFTEPKIYQIFLFFWCLSGGQFFQCSI